MTPSPEARHEERARTCFSELGYTTVYKETGTLAFYPKDLDRMIQKIATALAQAEERGRREERERCAQIAEIEWMHGKGALNRGQELVSGLCERIAAAIRSEVKTEGGKG